MGGVARWIDGVKSTFKDCLQQSKKASCNISVSGFMEINYMIQNKLKYFEAFI